jgi:GDP-4-dehydro-6-deoxy-D-mannose reductase
MRVLITGVTGFVGSHMAEFALAKGAEIFGACRWRSNTKNIEPSHDRLQLVEADLRDQTSAQEMLMLGIKTNSSWCKNSELNPS